MRNIYIYIYSKLLEGKAVRGHKAANKMEIWVPQAVSRNPFSEEWPLKGKG